jgi:poly-D-alanine transfer protein DltD
MKHINYKIETLLHEGFSMKTLENFNSKQIGLLYEKVKGKTKEVDEQIDVRVPQETLSDTLKQLEALPSGTKVTIETEVTEKAKSTQQQKIMGLSLSVKRGETPKSKVSKSVKDMANKMSEKDLEDFASTKHKGLPKKINSDKKTPESKKEVKKLEENILRLIEDHLPPHTTKGELLSAIKKRNR